MRASLTIAGVVACLAPSLSAAADKPTVVAVWEHLVVGRDTKPSTVTLYSNARTNDPDGKNTWSRSGNRLTLRWPNPDAPGGEWVDQCTVSADGKSYTGRNQIGTRITGKLVSEAAAQNPKAPADKPTPGAVKPAPVAPAPVAGGTKPEVKSDAVLKYTLYASLKNTEPRQAMAHLFDSAGKGYATAQNELGECYLKGEGVARDPQAAARWFQKSADQGNADGQYNLSGCYAAGEGVAKSDREAYRWELKAADANHGKALAKIAARHFGGIGVTKNPEEGLKWLKKSAAVGENWANTLYGMIYISGIGVEKDPAAAAKWFRKAADNGDPIAQFYLGCCYQRGTGVPADANVGKQWLTKSANAGYAPAKAQLAAKDTEQAVKALVVLVALAAAMQGNGGNNVADPNRVCQGAVDVILTLGLKKAPCGCDKFWEVKPSETTCRGCGHPKDFHSR